MPHFRHEKQLLIRDLKNKFWWAIWFRYGLAVLGFVFIYFSRISGAYIPLSTQLVSFVLAYNAGAHLIQAFKKHYELWQIMALAWIFQLFDITAITFLIYITGWLESPYWFLYLVMIILSGFGLFSYFSFSVFLIAFFSALFYFGLLLAAYLRLLPIYGPGFQLSPEQLLYSIYNKAIFTSVAFILFAAAIYHFSRLLNQQREDLSEKNAKLLAAFSKIKSVDHLKDDFISTASHELRTPLSVIRENVSLILDGIVGEINAKQKKLLETSRLNVDQLAKILENLLDISKIESHSLKPKREQVDLNQLATEAVRLLQPKAEHKGISIETKFPKSIFVWADPEQLLRVFVNLLDNAVKYTDQNGKIVVGAEDPRREVRAYISDNGPGIARADFDKIFERFVHLEHDKESLTKGAGLGLSICKEIIEMHGGRIWLESPPKGEARGAKFIFSLPKD